MLRGEVALGMILAIALYFGIFYLINVAVFRAIRYRLSRSYWHGIRGGSDDGGWGYGWSGIWRNLVGFIAFGLLVPWAMTSLWNERWNKMSYGPYPFEAHAEPSGLMGRWLLLYLAPFVALFAAGAVGLSLFSLAASGDAGDPTLAQGAVLSMLAVVAIFYLAILLLGLAYFAAYYRCVAAATQLGALRFEFRARTLDWLKLILGNIGLVIVTLGIGLIFLSYRNWKFVISHLAAEGEVDFEALTQSQTTAPGEAEGLADAFDIGAI
jgi:uncharacterized membrane protein YjgN (DUF898 family)